VKIEAGISCPWYVFFLATVLLITVLTYRGIEISATVVIWLTGVEMLIVACLALTSFMHPGDGHIQLQDFGSWHSFGQKGFTGWGNSHIASFASSTEAPVILLAKRLWGAAWILVLLAVTNSILAVAIAGTNSATRVFFAMGRARALPAALDYVHPQFQTPRNAILLQTFLTLAIGLGIGFCIGPDQEYYVMGVAMTLGLMFIYGAGNVGVYFYYRRQRPAEFSFLLHFFLPLLSTISLLWVAYKSAVPLPEPPVRYAPILAAVWLLVGIVVVLTVRRAAGTPLLATGEPLG
jgi:amino acid transporter